MNSQTQFTEKINKYPRKIQEARKSKASNLQIRKRSYNFVPEEKRLRLIEKVGNRLCYIYLVFCNKLHIGGIEQ